MGNPAVAAAIRKDVPDYDTWGPADFKKFPDSMLGNIMGAFSFRNEDADVYIPTSFRTRYGDKARYEFVHALMNEAASRRDANGRPTAGLAQSWVFLALGQAGIPKSADQKPAPVFPITLEGSNGEKIVRSVTPASLLSFDLSNILLDMEENKNKALETTVALSPDAIKALKTVNPKYKPESKVPEFIVGDETAVMAGYALSRGYASDVGYIEVVTDSNEICGAEAKAARALAPGQPEQPVYEAFKAGYWVAEIDKTYKAMRTDPNPTVRAEAANSMKEMFAACPDKIPTTNNVMTSLAPGTAVTPLSTGINFPSQVSLSGVPGS